MGDPLYADTTEPRTTCYVKNVQELGARLGLPPDTNPDVVIRKAIDALPAKGEQLWRDA